MCARAAQEERVAAHHNIEGKQVDLPPGSQGCKEVGVNIELERLACESEHEELI